MDILFDYTVLRIIWWILLGVIFWIFALTDGFDLGVASLMPFVTKKDEERRVLLNTVGPVWEGNQAWLILAAGAIFAAWPLLYGALFTGFYLPLFFVLASLILRPVGFKYRSKLENTKWRGMWDMCLFLGGVIPSLCFGLVLGALVSGAYFEFDDNLRLIAYNNLPSLFHPLALASGVVWLLLFVTHGALYLCVKTEGSLKKKIQDFIPLRLWASIVMYFVFLCVWRVTIPLRDVIMSTDMPSNPLAKSVLAVEPAKDFLSWLPLSAGTLISLVCFMGLTVLIHKIYLKHAFWAWVVSCVRMAMVIASVGLGNYPILLTSLTNVNHSLTLWDASSSRLTLIIMLISAIIFVPLMIWLASWVYDVLKGPVSKQDIQKKSHELY
ncbi:cytochrome d ubiquinol oxidase subunit II [Candidatus Hepatobacter penaei]|uniref:cytochrome d ubiquinol oxidase subunit II n=1 Tax=Candidatus Hepatobacter penaei TaxID=1274402 RepID=UPI0004F2AFD3|nr:cytochrome d ubiquinol oxidase subunit II [Candidatus Hepatobacter penaei]TGW15224.1 cytochrome d ubiquinol oxidase subunit II [bacterium NHP-B]